MVIVTAGGSYVDIDAYAAIISYAELLRVSGVQSQAVIAGVLNESITQTIRSWDVAYSTDYIDNPEDTFALMDISDQKYFSSFVDLDRVATVIDHHPGYEQYWRKKIGSGAIIEQIGAAATLVFEQWQQSGHIHELPKVCARLIATAILDNTLNFGAHITTQRDRDAYQRLSDFADIAPDWPEKYFMECQRSITADIQNAIKNDHKIVTFLSHGSTGQQIGVGQLAIWDITELSPSYLVEIDTALSEIHSPWFMNLLCLKEGVSYFICTDEVIRNWLSRVLGVEFIDQTARAHRPWLRKEIIRADIAAK